MSQRNPQPTARRSRRISTRDLTVIAILAAISAVLFYFPELPLPLMPYWMKLDFSNVPAIIGAFALGPWAGVLILLIKDLIGLTHTTSLGIGEAADFLMSVAYILPAGLIYWRRKSRGTAVVGMLVGTAGIIVAGCLTNYYILIPVYGMLFGMSLEDILAVASASLPAVKSLWTYVLWVVVPFNLVKGLVISVITFALYKLLSPILHGRKETP